MSANEMENLTAREKLCQYIERASKTELLFVIAYIAANYGAELAGMARPEFMSRGDCKRIIKRMREAQRLHPSERDKLEAAIQFIRRECLHREVIA